MVNVFGKMKALLEHCTFGGKEGATKINEAKLQQLTKLDLHQ